MPSRAATQIRDVLGDARLVVADVGAANGVLPHFRPLQEVSTFYLFEPEKSAYEKLVSDLARAGRENVRVLNTALAASTGQRKLHVANQPTGSSLLRPRPDATDYTISSYFFPMREIEIHTERLGAALDGASEPALHMIKIDVQGGELEVLQGLDDARARTLLSAQVEVGMPGSYEGQPSLGELDGWMRARGLVLFDVEPARASLTLDDDSDAYHTRVFKTFRRAPSVRSRLWEVDAFYFRDEAEVLARKDAGDVRRLMVAYGTHGFFAHAHRLADRAREAGVLTPSDARTLQRTLVRWHDATLDRRVTARARRTFKRFLHLALTPEQATRMYALLRS